MYIFRRAVTQSLSNINTIDFFLSLGTVPFLLVICIVFIIIVSSRSSSCSWLVFFLPCLSACWWQSGKLAIGETPARTHSQLSFPQTQGRRDGANVASTLLMTCPPAVWWHPQVYTWILRCAVEASTVPKVAEHRGDVPGSLSATKWLRVVESC